MGGKQRFQMTEGMQRICSGQHHDPFQVLGPQRRGDCVTVRAYLPWAKEARVEVAGQAEPMTAVADSGFFVWRGTTQLDTPYRLQARDSSSHWHWHYDPYSFGPQVGELDLHLFGEGRHWQIYQVLGANPRCVDGVDGVLFATWAPSAERVSVVGDFNGWQETQHPMRCRGSSGVWELFIPGIEPGALYKFSLRSRHDGQVRAKSDPYGQWFEKRPDTAAKVAPVSDYAWGDGDWLAQRAEWDWQHRPVSVYELHLGSWQTAEDGGFLGYRELAHRLADYVGELGFTHVELMPVTEHPLDASWGYQTTGYFAPTSRFGEPDDFRYLVDHLHRAGIGVILDWVPAHFPKDSHALARFDGTALYEHEDPRRGEHRDWGTLIYNFGRNEVRNFLIASALYWLEEYHLDGLRVDAVASMLHLDYSREDGDWIPNIHGGNENLEAIDFLQQLNTACQGRNPGVTVMAEESTAWPQVTRPTWVGGLGFSMKWNMGWMHDTLEYFNKDPVYRHYHHDQLTFGLMYAFTENFLLPLSHDEVVHGKGSMINKMPGDDWQRFANLRLLYTYQFTYPGTKLLFMGSEFAQEREWGEQRGLDWPLLEQPYHAGMRNLVSDLNARYRHLPALYERCFESEGFEWIDCHDNTQSVLSYLRKSRDGGFVVVILNFTPEPRQNYRIGVPEPGTYRELLNSDSRFYGGSDLGNATAVRAEAVSWMQRPYSIELTLPPLGGLILSNEPAT